MDLYGQLFNPCTRKGRNQTYQIIGQFLLLNKFSKIFEKVMSKRVKHHLNNKSTFVNGCIH
jgi:hypothetical protein